MTPERWKRTEELYHAAYERPPGERRAVRTLDENRRTALFDPATMFEDQGKLLAEGYAGETRSALAGIEI